MVKYSEEFKLKVVQDYLTGTLGFTLLTRKYGISDNSIVRRWVRAKKQFYSVQFKLDVLIFMKQTGASYQETAIQFKMNNPSSLIASWNSRFLKEGIEGLQEKRRGAHLWLRNQNQYQLNKKNKWNKIILVTNNYLLEFVVQLRYPKLPCVYPCRFVLYRGRRKANGIKLFRANP